MTLEETINFIKGTIEGTELQNKVYVVGGYCRDIMLGVEPKDLEILINGTSDQLNHLLSLLLPMSTSHAEYPRFGVAMLTIGGNQVEFVLPRKESYSDSRKPEVEVGVSLYEDALRRDFTINTLLYNISTGEYEDPTGKALCNLKNRILATNNKVDITLEDDPLRILRAIRFLMEYHLKPKRSLLKGIERNSDKVCPPKVSLERIKDEFIKILSLIGEYTREENLILILKVLSKVVPELKYVSAFSLLNRCSIEDNYKVKIASLLYLLPIKSIKSILKRLTFSNSGINSILKLIEFQPKIPTDYPRYWLEYDYRNFILESGNDREDILRLRSLIYKHNKLNYIDCLEKRISNYESIKPSIEIKSPLDGNDLIELFGLQGKDVGKVKSHLTFLALSGILDSNDRDRAIVAAEEFLKKC
jgi:tRNA nucleotidyltransferase/poly(A) polymerase